MTKFMGQRNKFGLSKLCYTRVLKTINYKEKIAPWENENTLLYQEFCYMRLCYNKVYCTYVSVVWIRGSYGQMDPEQASWCSEGM